MLFVRLTPSPRHRAGLVDPAFWLVWEERPRALLLDWGEGCSVRAESALVHKRVPPPHTMVHLSQIHNPGCALRKSCWNNSFLWSLEDLSGLSEALGGQCSHHSQEG